MSIMGNKKVTGYSQQKWAMQSVCVSTWHDMPLTCGTITYKPQWFVSLIVNENITEIVDKRKHEQKGLGQVT